MQEISFTIDDYRVPSWNQLYAGRHWAERSRMAQEAHLLVWGILQGKIKYTLGLPRVDIYIKAYQKGKTLDSDNICAKIIIDALKGIVIVDDTPQYVRRVTTESLKGNHDYVEVHIIEAGE